MAGLEVDRDLDRVSAREAQDGVAGRERAVGAVDEVRLRAPQREQPAVEREQGVRVLALRRDVDRRVVVTRTAATARPW